MTAVMDPAEARRSASAMMRSSITLSFVGLLVGWMMNASTPRTFSPISTKLSPSLNRMTRHLPSGVSRYWAIASASGGFALPEKRQTFLNTAEPPLRGGLVAGSSHTVNAEDAVVPRRPRQRSIWAHSDFGPRVAFSMQAL